MSGTLSREDAQALAKRVLALSTATEARVSINSGMRGNARFAVVGYARKPMNDDVFREEMRKGCDEFARRRMRAIVCPHICRVGRVFETHQERPLSKGGSRKASTHPTSYQCPVKQVGISCPTRYNSLSAPI